MTNEIDYILRAVAERPVSSTDSSCAFCQAYGDEPHGMMEFDENHECVVLTAQRLLAHTQPNDVIPPEHLIFLPEPPVAVFPKPPHDD